MPRKKEVKDVKEVEEVKLPKKKEVKKIEEKKEEPVVVEPVKVEEPTLEPVKVQPVVTEKPKKKKKCWWISPLIILLVFIGSVIGIQWYTGRSKAVATRAVDKVYNEARDELKELERLHKKFDITKPIKGTYSMTIESDMKELKSISGMKFSGTFGLDAEEEIFVLEGSIKNKAELNAGFGIDGDEVYLKLLDEVIDLSDEAEMDTEFFEEFTDMIYEYEPDFKNLQIVIKSLRDAVVKGISEDALERSLDTITLDDKELKVNKVSYTLDKKSVKYLLKTFGKTLKNDKKFLNAIDKLAEEYDLDFDKDDVKDELDELIEQADDVQIEADEKVVINIYSHGIFNELVGFDIRVNKQEVIRWYDYKGYKELIFDSSADGETSKLIITGKEKGKKTEYVVKMNKQKIATATVRSWESDKVDVDFTIYDDESDQEISGTIYVTSKEGKHDFTGEYKFAIEAELEDQDIDFEISGDYSIEFDADVEMFSTKKAKDVEDVDWDKLKKKLLEEVEDDKQLKNLITYLTLMFKSKPVVTYDYNYNLPDLSDYTIAIKQ